MWDTGWRKFTYDAVLEVPLAMLTYFLPCEVVAAHHGQLLTNLALRDAPVVNTACKVITPGPSLQTYDQAHVETDCCTNRLQGLLDDGWRILAICVQPDQRRPDYVLGRRRAGNEPAPPFVPDRPKPMPDTMPNIPF
jgi:hypothetical protein